MLILIENTSHYVWISLSHTQAQTERESNPERGSALVADCENYSLEKLHI